MFEKVIFWCEFPKKIDFNKADRLLGKYGIKSDVYIACKSLEKFKRIKRKNKKIKNMQFFPWPILKKKDGYWFSGFCSKNAIKKLEQFEGFKIKLDLEPPFPKFKFSNRRFALMLFSYFFKKGKNNQLLKKEIEKLTQKNEIIVNEFPLPKFYLKKLGIYCEEKKNVIKNIMCYTTICGKLLRPLLSFYNFTFLRILLRKNRNLMCSIGLIGKGILKNEGTYNSVREFFEDLGMAEKLGIKRIAIYSIEGIFKRKNPEEWLNAIKSYLRLK